MSHVDKGCAREALATPYIPVKSKKEQRFLLYRIFYGKELVYIGRTKQPLQNRLRGHFFQKPMHRTIDIEMVSRVQYAEFPTEADMNLYEIYFILTRHPPLNVDDKTRDYPTVTLPDVEWKGTTPESRMESPEIMEFFTNPVDHSTSWTPTMDSRETAMGSTMGGAI